MTEKPKRGVNRLAREAFLAALASGWSVSKAALVADVARASIYRHRAADPTFAAAWDEALETGSDAIEDEARRRAVDGVSRPVFYKGKVCGTVQECSDSLLLAILRARRPEKYRDNSKIEHRLSDTLEALVLRSMAPKAGKAEPVTDDDASGTNAAS